MKFTCAIRSRSIDRLCQSVLDTVLWLNSTCMRSARLANVRFIFDTPAYIIAACAAYCVYVVCAGAGRVTATRYICIYNAERTHKINNTRTKQRASEWAGERRKKRIRIAKINSVACVVDVVIAVGPSFALCAKLARTKSKYNRSESQARGTARSFWCFGKQKKRRRSMFEQFVGVAFAFLFVSSAFCSTCLLFCSFSGEALRQAVGRRWLSAMSTNTMPNQECNCA